MLGSTSGTDLQPILEAVEHGILNVNIAVVISNNKDAYILERAKIHNVKEIFLDPKGKPKEKYDAEISKILDYHKIKLVLLIGYLRILSKEFVDEWGLKTMNVHPSLLPKYAGGMDMNVHEAVLNSGDKESGMTIHFITEEADKGPIILQKRCNVDRNETIESLKAKVQKLEGEGLIEAIKLFDGGKIKITGDDVTIMK